jgi:fructose-1,6-bisphosphatase/inositol monophosphatase family enzyme
MQFARLWAELGTDIERMLGAFRGRLAELDVVEKSDHTLLTEADTAIQNMIVEHIRSHDTHAHIVAEETSDDQWRSGSAPLPERVWVIDPIDGTAQFVRDDRVEYCSVVVVLENLEPVHALVVAPELGAGRSALTLTAARADRTVTVNGAPAKANTARAGGSSASVTRSSGTEPRPFEQTMTEAGYALKTRTSSQTLDMVRTALDLSELTDDPVRFDLFFRTEQKIWDGLAGLCFGAVTGMAQADISGSPRVPVSQEILAQPEPTFPSTVMGIPEAVTWFVKLAANYPAGAARYS